ncbi:AAA family ATPase [Thalassomonas actiniarum]|uniref:AAA family ATPase n=1 Tax=Thalassomonas actiniarum TaxID=485447 RepID=A0AAE9YQ71_9GAMM|nr:AAA family ATPase [Thalassomonas actiniarum]WDD98488.1 AAA family ATPase [Thalassomonas actiniarum]
MKLQYLKITSPFKNINGIEIKFSTSQGRTVIVGQNGTGKSNIIEALVHIFKQLESGLPPRFSYQLKYKIGEGDVETWLDISADKDITDTKAQYQIQYQEYLNGKPATKWLPVAITKVKRDRAGLSRFLPRNVFAYYSGPSDRLESLFYQARKTFYLDVIQDGADFRDNIRPFFYAKPFHSQFALLALFAARGFPKALRFLEKELCISSFESATFVLKKPDWGSNDATDFWGASGAIREFLELIKQHCIGPIETQEPIPGQLSKRVKNRTVVSYFLPHKKQLDLFTKNMRPDVFFKFLEASYLSGILERVKVEVKQTKSHQNVEFTQLSEGEQQLLTIVGLLQFTAKQDALFLLDEPDTHLNPNWAAKYHRFLDIFVPDEFRSHIVMTTHHPLSIAELEKEQIQVVKRDENTQQVSVSTPDKSPRGMNVNGILTSDMFGLLTTLDNETQALIRERKKLVVEENDPERLNELNTQLEQLGYGYIHPDEDYRQFLIARSKYLEYGQEVASVEARKQMIKNILKDMKVSPDEIR